MFGPIRDYLSDQLQQIRDAGLFKGERSSRRRKTPAWACSTSSRC